MARKRRESDKRYYLNHRIEILEKQKEYVSRNKEKTKEYHKEYYSKNKESIKERMKKSGVSPRGRIAVRLDALIHYGGPSPACDCCGEDKCDEDADNMHNPKFDVSGLICRDCIDNGSAEEDGWE